MGWVLEQLGSSFVFGGCVCGRAGLCNLSKVFKIVKCPIVRVNVCVIERHQVAKDEPKQAHLFQFALSWTKRMCRGRKGVLVSGALAC